MNPHSLDYVRLMLFYFVTIGFRSSNNRPIYARRLPGSCSAIPLKWARTLVIGKAPFVLCSQIDLGPTQWATNWGKVDISDQDDNIARSSAQSLIDPLLTPTKMQYIYTHTRANYAILNCKTNCCEANNNNNLYKVLPANMHHNLNFGRGAAMHLSLLFFALSSHWQLQNNPYKEN